MSYLLALSRAFNHIQQSSSVEGVSSVWNNRPISFHFIPRERYHSRSEICGILSTVSSLAVNLYRSEEVNKKISKHTHTQTQTHTPALCGHNADEADVHFFFFFYSLFIGLTGADFAYCSQNKIIVTQYVKALRKDLSVHILYCRYKTINPSV